MEEENTAIVVRANPDRKVFGLRQKPKGGTEQEPLDCASKKVSATPKISKIPADILENESLKKAIARLPENYNFEIEKTLWRIRTCEAKRVALQFPEGLLVFSLTIADILEEFGSVEIIIMGDVTYGACCIDDFTAAALKADLTVHYGHSCLVPVDITSGTKVMYVFVDIKIDFLHLIETVKLNFSTEKILGLVSTIQFVPTIHLAAKELKSQGFNIVIPQSKPLSPGEILGCTSPNLKGVDAVLYVGDGRFHLESTMIANPTLPLYRYNPYDKKLTEEQYEYSAMLSFRQESIAKAHTAGTFGLILGTLGRQGSPTVLKNIQQTLHNRNKTFVTVLLSEIFPDKLKLFHNVDAWIQIACPRLSIDWGRAFQKPILTSYEAVIALEDQVQVLEKYPMDYYAHQSLGNWTPNFKEPKKDCCKECSCKDKK